MRLPSERMAAFFRSPQTTFTAKVCVAPFLDVLILPISACLCGFTCVCIIVLVLVIVFSSVCVMEQGLCVCTSNRMSANFCVQLFWHSGQLRLYLTTKRILILSSLTGRGGVISFPWKTTQVNCLVLCMSVVMDKQWKESGEACKPGLRVMVGSD